MKKVSVALALLLAAQTVLVVLGGREVKLKKERQAVKIARFNLILEQGQPTAVTAQNCSNVFAVVMRDFSLWPLIASLKL